MGKLQDRLDRMRAGAHEKMPAEVVVTMGAATQALRESGILDRIPAVGTTLADFELPDTEGGVVSSTALRAQGPLVVTFYRGHW